MAADEQPQVLDRAAFFQEVPVLALRVPKQRCHQVVKSLKGYVSADPQPPRTLLQREKKTQRSARGGALRRRHIWDRHKIPAVLHEPGLGADAPTRLVRLNETITADGEAPLELTQPSTIAQPCCAAH